MSKLGKSLARAKREFQLQIRVQILDDPNRKSAIIFLLWVERHFYQECHQNLWSHRLHANVEEIRVAQTFP